VVRVEKQIV
jgi:hypothetical protein